MGEPAHTGSTRAAAFAPTGRRVEADVSTAQQRRPLEELSGTARRAAVWTLVVLGIGVFAIAVWRLRLVVALLFLAFVIAAAMRPGVEALARRRVPPSVSVAVHYLASSG